MDRAGEWYRIIAENTSDTIVLVDNDAIVRYVSPSITAIAGYSLADYQGFDAFDIIHPDDMERVRASHAQAVQTKMPVDLEYRLVHATGTAVHVEARVKPVLNGNGSIDYVVAVVRDITERKKTEKLLQESEQRYKSLFENNLDGVFSIDLQLNFENANRSFEEISGIRLSTLTDRCFMGLIFDEDHPQVYEVLYQVMQLQEPRDIECRIQKGVQGEKIVSITFVPIFLSGMLNGVHGIVKDITERKREEKELIQSEERYKYLQQSLNRFSSDLANVMKVSDLEQRLIAEVKDVLQVTDATVEEVPRGQEHAFMNREQDTWVRIGEKQQPVYLRIAIKQAVLPIEQEWLETAVHYVTILYDNLQLLEDLMKRLEDLVSRNETPRWMLRLLFKLSEKERSSLSGDLHDSVLQDLIIWYRKLESLRSSGPFKEETRSELIRIEEGLLDAIHQIRITCNELRPPFLLKMGLVESLKSLLSYTRMFANYEIEFSSEQFDSPLNEEEILGMYRIVQELLNNASKHSEASKVRMVLTGQNHSIHFAYSDDGVGMDLSSYENSFQHMGLAGIEKRVFSLGGEVAFNSAPNRGFHVSITIPGNSERKGETYGNIAG